MSITIKGKFIKWSGYAGEGQIDPTATIELYSPTPSEISKLKEGDEVLVRYKVEGIAFGDLIIRDCEGEKIYVRNDVVAILPQPQQFPISACCNASVEKVFGGDGTCHNICQACNKACYIAENKPQQIITNSLCDTCQKVCKSDSQYPITQCQEYKPVCDCESYQGSDEDRNCKLCGKPIRTEVKPETCGISVKDDSRTYGCPHCGRPIRKTELASDKGDELENILICFGENFGEVRLEDINKYIREGKEKILALVGKVSKPKKEIEPLTLWEVAEMSNVYPTTFTIAEMFKKINELIKARSDEK